MYQYNSCWRGVCWISNIFSCFFTFLLLYSLIHVWWIVFVHTSFVYNTEKCVMRSIVAYFDWTEHRKCKLLCLIPCYSRRYRGRRLCWAQSERRDYDGRSRLHSSGTEECPVAHGEAEADSYGNPGRETPQLHTATRQQPTHTPHAPSERRTENAQWWV